MTDARAVDDRRRPQVIVDCDPGLDDAAALAIAAEHTDILGITTVGGNAPLDAVTTNALLTAQIFGIDAEVYPGADHPLVAPVRNAPEIHGASGFAGASLPSLERSAAETHAVDFIVESARSHEGLWLIPTGPLTNIALAIRRAPDIVGRLAGISFMGGSATVGNHTPVGEFNLLVDPEAAAVVVDAETSVLMCGLDLTHQFVVDDELSAALRSVGNAGANLLADLVDGYLDRVEQIRGRRRGGLHDPCAVLAVTHPDLVRRTRRRVGVELTGTLTRGMTVVDRRGDPDLDQPDGNVDHCHTLDPAAVRGVLLDAVRARG